MLRCVSFRLRAGGEPGRTLRKCPLHWNVAYRPPPPLSIYWTCFSAYEEVRYLVYAARRRSEHSYFTAAAAAALAKNTLMWESRAGRVYVFFLNTQSPLCLRTTPQHIQTAGCFHHRVNHRHHGESIHVVR